MHEAGDQGVAEWLILNSLDEAALHAFYSRLSAGTAAGDLDPNSPRSQERRLDPRLRPRSGSATWSDRLVGLTPQAEAVAGAADMTVQLATLRGALDFTSLEHRAAHVAPGAIGTGSQWGDGDLSYRIEVNGQVFYETGGDTGKVTGAFFGPNYDRVGGTLRRHDLAAGFGAQRL